MNGGDLRPADWIAKVLLIVGLLLVVNSAYVAAFGDPTLFYVANSLLHPVLGVPAAALFLIYVRRHRTVFRGALGRSLIALPALGVTFGVYLAVVGMTRPHTVALAA